MNKQGQLKCSSKAIVNSEPITLRFSNSSSTDASLKIEKRRLETRESKSKHATPTFPHNIEEKGLSDEAILDHLYVPRAPASLRDLLKGDFIVTSIQKTLINLTSRSQHLTRFERKCLNNGLSSKEEQQVKFCSLPAHLICQSLDPELEESEHKILQTAQEMQMDDSTCVNFKK